jgi:hypothetical protein
LARGATGCDLIRNPPAITMDRSTGPCQRGAYADGPLDAREKMRNRRGGDDCDHVSASHGQGLPCQPRVRRDNVPTTVPYSRRESSRGAASLLMERACKPWGVRRPPTGPDHRLWAASPMIAAKRSGDTRGHARWGRVSTYHIRDHPALFFYEIDRNQPLGLKPAYLSQMKCETGWIKDGGHPAKRIRWSETTTMLMEC